MVTLGSLLGWKFDNAPGIVTRDGVLTEWPSGLGPRPTDDQITTWTAEYEAAQPPDFHWLTASESERNEEMRKRLGIPD
jgi:hypothetical protein